MIKESEVLKRIAEAIHDADLPQLAQLHNEITNHPPIRSDEITDVGGCLTVHPSALES